MDTKELEEAFYERQDTNEIDLDPEEEDDFDA